MAFSFPSKGLVFWPVGSGDSTTLVVRDDAVLQVDLRHLEASEDDEDERWAVVDELVELLPKRNGRPYLSVFALSHPDMDHCQGFAKLLEHVHLGELWFTPRIFREYKKELSPDAVVFRDEAKRRVNATIKAGGNPASGDRVRIVGFDDLLNEDDYKGFPIDRLTVPGNAITTLDDTDLSEEFRAFVHSPFKDDLGGDRNDTSLGLQVTLRSGAAAVRVLLLGDLTYPIIKKIFDRSSADDLAWSVLLAPHHCSKSVMYWKDDPEGEEQLKQDILDAIEKAASKPGYIVSSSDPVPASNKVGDNPPHAKAKKRYEEIVTDGFLCTQEYPNEQSPEPIVFEVDDGGLVFLGKAEKGGAMSLTLAAAAARGSDSPPRDRVGYGCPE